MDTAPSTQNFSNNASLAQSLEDRQHRLQQARDYLKRTQDLFEHFGSAELKMTQARFESLQQALNADQIRLVVLGEYSRGKSELLNALLGIELLPTAQETTTAVNTFLQALPHGRTQRFIRIHYQDGRQPEEINWTDDQAIKRWGTELDHTNQDARLAISRIEVFHDHDLLNKGLVLIDTPGLQTIVKHHEEITHRAIAEAHVALWVQATDQLGGTDTEWKFMSRTLRRNFQKFITVINKWDRVLEPEDSHDKQLSEQARIDSKRAVVIKNFKMVLGDQQSAELDRLTNDEHLFGVSARWGRDADAKRRERSNIARLARRIAEMVTSGEAQEQIILKPLTQLADIQSQLGEYIESELALLDADKNDETRAQELAKLEVDIRELKMEEERETRESRDEHERAARVLTEKMRDQLLQPLTELRNSIEDQVTELYVRRMISSRAAKIGLPDELDQQYRQLAAEMEQIWQSQKTQLSETLTGLRANYLDAMNKHAQGIESNLGQMNIKLPQLTLDLDFDFSALEDHRQRSSQINEKIAQLEEELDTDLGTIDDTLNRLRHNTISQLNDSIARIEHYLNESLRQVFIEQADMLAGCVREQILEPLNGKRKQQEDIQILMQQSQEQIAAYRAELVAARQALAKVQQLTQDALKPA